MPSPNLHLNCHSPFSGTQQRNKSPFHLVLFWSMQIKEDKFFYHFNVAPLCCQKKWFSSFLKVNHKLQCSLYTYWAGKATNKVGSSLRGGDGEEAKVVILVTAFWGLPRGGWKQSLSLQTRSISELLPQTVGTPHQHRIIFMGVEKYCWKLSSQAPGEMPPHNQTMRFPFKCNNFTNFLHLLNSSFTRLFIEKLILCQTPSESPAYCSVSLALLIKMFEAEIVQGLIFTWLIQTWRVSTASL